MGPIATLLYGFSILYCMTPLAEGGEGPGTLGLPEPALRELAAKAGFAWEVSCRARMGVQYITAV